MAGELELAGSYKKTTKGHVDWYYGGGSNAWANKAAAYAGIPPVLREGMTFGVWESGKVVEYQWKTSNVNDGAEELKAAVSAGSNTEIDDTVESTTKTWSSQKIANENDLKVDKVAGKGLSTNDFTTADKNKLDAIEEKFKGKFTSLAALEAAHPTAEVGDYANVDTGVGNDAIEYIWDTEDGWVQSSQCGYWSWQ